MADSEQVVVIGGGFSGLACAFRLRQLSVPVTLLESAGHVGGLIGTVEQDGFLFESGPQSFQGTDAILDLVREAGPRKRDVPGRSARSALCAASRQARKDSDVSASHARAVPCSVWGRGPANRFRSAPQDEAAERGGVRRRIRAPKVRTRNSRIPCHSVCFGRLRGGPGKTEPPRGVSYA